MAMEKINMRDYNAELPEGIPAKLKGIDINNNEVVCNPSLSDAGIIDGTNLKNIFNAFGFCGANDGSGIAGMFLSINKKNSDSSISGFQLKVSSNNDIDPIVKIRVLEGDGAYDISNWFSIPLSK